MGSRLLVIDDEKMVREMLVDLMSGAGYEVSAAADGQEAVELLDARGPDFFDFLLCDVRMPRVSGLEFLEHARNRGCTAPIIVMSAYGDMDTAIEAMKLGAYDYISKPFKTDEVLLTLKKAEERERLLQENRELKRTVQSTYRFENLVAKSPKMLAIFDVLRKVADYRSAVLFLGESGTGKEVLARALHYNSKRRDGPFLSVDCGAAPEQTLEGDLFGHERGAFADATRSKRGALEEAQGGTLLLKEVGQLAPFLQVRLLRTLQEGTFRRAGGSRDLPLEVRVVAAASPELPDRVAQGQFREELFYRLNVIPVTVPPLRERRDDLPLLVSHFLRRFAAETGKEVRSLSPEAMDAILRYSWKGNVRELENLLERAVVLVEGPVIGLGHLAPWLQEDGRDGALGLSPEDSSIKKVSARMEEELIRRALRRTGGNRTEASRILEISHRTLLYKIKGYGIKEK